MRFRNRQEAGAKLAVRLGEVLGGSQVDPVVIAVSRGGVPVAAEVAAALGAELAVWTRREAQGPEVRGRTVVLVDDGLVAGTDAAAVVRLLRAAGPALLVLAAPVCSPRATALLAAMVDHLVCVDRPWYFRSIGDWYDDLHVLSDHEVAAAAHS